MTSYYHWCGYSDSSLNIATLIAEDIAEKLNIDIEALSTGDGDNLSKKDLAEILYNIPGGYTAMLSEVDATTLGVEYSIPFSMRSRNKGIVDIQEEGINSSLRYAEALVIFDLDRMIMNVNEVFWTDDDDYEATDEEIMATTFDNLDSLSFSKAQELCYAVRDTIGVYKGLAVNGEVHRYIY